MCSSLHHRPCYSSYSSYISRAVAEIGASAQNQLRSILFSHYNFLQDLIICEVSVLELQPARKGKQMFFN